MIQKLDNTRAGLSGWLPPPVGGIGELTDIIGLSSAHQSNKGVIWKVRLGCGEEVTFSRVKSKKNSHISERRQLSIINVATLKKMEQTL